MSRPSILFVLALTLSVPASVSAHDFSYDTLLLGWMKLKGDDFDHKANAEAYLRLYRSDTWNDVKDDEFKVDREKKKTVEIMKGKVKEFDLTQEFTLDTKMAVKKYDFDEKLFPLGSRWQGNSVTRTSYWYPNSRYPTGTLPSRTDVYFSNPELLASFPMAEADAEKFVEGHKERDRMVAVRIQFTLTKAREGAGELQAEIQSVTISDTLGKKRILHKATRAVKVEKDKAKKDQDKKD